ncbi:MAG: FtsH protease activity modulator HflK [Deltaproteobacteria bacterium]|nr:MAG: FtsH protease activity modulator HflK [Deltaproteobacteria bacterium]
MKGRLPGGWIILVILLVIWLASGIYIVAPDEAGVVKRFGKYIYTTKPGPHFHIPYPVETVVKPKVTEVKRIEIGFRTIDAGPPARYRSVPKESLMLTGDENIVDMDLIVQYKVKDPVDYLFNVYNIPKTVKDATEAAIREVVGKNNIDEILTTGKYQVQQDTKKLLQGILDKYKAGIMVVAVQLQDVHPPEQVMQAFKDVASAKEDKIKYINEAQGYRNDIMPKAKGQAEKVINEAQAYLKSKVAEAEGDASRFLQVYEQYKSAKDITRKRLYIETMEKVLPRAKKIVIDPKVGGRVLPLLPLDQGLNSGQLPKNQGKR